MCLIVWLILYYGGQKTNQTCAWDTTGEMNMTDSDLYLILKQMCSLYVFLLDDLASVSSKWCPEICQHSYHFAGH